jgi:hypothetical protein
MVSGSVLRLSVPGQQPLTEGAKAEIGRKADDPDYEDAGKDALGAKCLLSPQNHITHSDRRPDHLGGDDHDQRNALGVEQHIANRAGTKKPELFPFQIVEGFDRGVLQYHDPLEWMARRSEAAKKR